MENPAPIRTTPDRVNGARPGVIEQPADERPGEADAERADRVDRDGLRAVPAERVGDRQQENREGLAHAARQRHEQEDEAEHQQSELRRAWSGAPGGGEGSLSMGVRQWL